MDDKKFFIGLDIGTTSVGFSATDENYDVLKKGGNPLMGVRLFDEAKTAAERRVFRANKVRKGRVKARLSLLQELFCEEIEKVDPLFFVRLNSSAFWEDDKQANGLTTLNSLFADEKYTDKTHFEKFKTIYHLRYYLMQEENWTEKLDIRLVYLACHHIIKNRGHFLSNSDNISENGKALFVRLNNILQDKNESNEDDATYYTTFNLDNFSEVEALAQVEKLSRKEKKEQLQALFKTNKNKAADAMLGAILGFKTKIKVLLNVEDDDELETKDFSLDNDWEALEPKLAEAFQEDFVLAQLLKEIYDWFNLTGRLKGSRSVSEMMINEYNKHAADLEELKSIVRNGAREKYNKIFRETTEAHNYAAYVGSNNTNGKKTITPAALEQGKGGRPQCTQEDFYKFLKTELGDLIPHEMQKDMENNRFMPKLRTKNNAGIPYQLHRAELIAIAGNAAKYYNLESKKLTQILEFRVPYFVGRLNPYYKNNPDKSHHVWIEKNPEFENECTKITPFNFDQIVDLDKSEEAFIGRMQSKCTYLREENVLPKYSLIFSEYTVLNELNKLKIKGEPITVAEKQRIFNELFKTQKNVTVTKLLKFLGQDVEKGDITGFDTEKGGFTASLASFHQARAIFGDAAEQENAQKIMEDAILWHSISNDKDRVEKRLKTTYPDLDSRTLKGLKGLNCNKFGSLSKKFLTSKSIIEKKTGEFTSVLDILRNTNLCLMEIIHSPLYNVEEWLAHENESYYSTKSTDAIDDTYASPAVKRAVRQAFLVVDELVEIIGKTPDKIFIEVTRENTSEQDKKRTLSRHQRLQKYFKKIPKFNTNHEYKALNEQLDNASPDALRGEKLYLYFLQLGKCAYSGEPINISDISNDKEYDVDHIIPQALKKDDSLNNKVLVKKVLNAKKDKNYPLNKTPEIWKNADKLIPIWKMWKEYGLITPEKLDRLMRTHPIKAEEQEGFIARQLVFTGQSATVTADLFKTKFKDAEIVYSKAQNVSDFRKKFDLLKCRDANDLHHAHDAYLNIVVGNVYNERFNHGKDFYMRKYEKTDEAWKAYSENHMFEYDVKNAWQGVKKDENGDFIKNENLKRIERVLSLKYIPVTKKVQEKTGALYEQTIYPAPNNQKALRRAEDKTRETDGSLIPRKCHEKNPLSDTSKYGGFKALSTAYFMIIEHTKIKKSGKVETLYRQKTFETVSLLEKNKWEELTEEEQLKKLEQNGYKEPKILFPKIKVYSLFKIGNVRCRIAGTNGKNIRFHNATQWFIDKDTSDYIRIISKFFEMAKTKKYNLEKMEELEDIIVSGGEKSNSKPQVITKDKNEKVWDVALKTLKSLYHDRMVNLRGKSLGLPDMYEKLLAMQDTFKNLPTVKQAKVISNLIRGLGCNAEAFDLKELGGGASAGIIQPSKDIKYPLTIIYQSPTGHKERQIVIHEE